MNAPHESAKFDDISGVIRHYNEVIQNMGDWREALEGVEPEVTDFGDVYELAIDGPGDAALVVMEAGKHPISDIEYHVDETELHFPVAGRARIWNHDTETEVGQGDNVVVEPETAHFSIPISSSGDYVALVVSYPGFDPDNLVSLSGDVQAPAQMGPIRNLYLGLVAALNAQ